MKIVIIDGQGGGIGKQLTESIKAAFPDDELTAVGTNVAATISMQKAGADHSATGENAVIVACRTADVILGPIGIVVADSLYGEITPAMALAAAQSRAVRILVPMNKCDTIIAGVAGLGLSSLIDDCIQRLKASHK